MTSEILSIPGIKVSTACAQIKQTQKADLTLFEMAEGSNCAAVFTRNQFCAAPVTLARRHLEHTPPRYLLINSGNANAGTGPQGIEDALACCQAVAEQAHCSIEEVLPFSTGVIGQRLPVEKIIRTVPTVLSTLEQHAWDKAAQAIMTTDIVPKIASQQVEIQGKTVTIIGIAKGSGMIKPDMATMLAFIACDAKVPTSVLQNCLNSAVKVSFNCITVDGDTSTNDACVLVATGKSGVCIDSPQDTDFLLFSKAVDTVCVQLAHAIVRDGEGATKFITIHVEQGASEKECFDVAYTIAHSPLVKTAFFASDANWGRIFAAIGRSPVENLVIEKVSIFIGDLCVVQQCGIAPGYTEARAAQIMKEKEITIRVSLDRGSYQATVWTCDLSYDYVKINAEYRT